MVRAGVHLLAPRARISTRTLGASTTMLVASVQCGGCAQRAPALSGGASDIDHDRSLLRAALTNRLDEHTAQWL